MIDASPAATAAESTARAAAAATPSPAAQPPSRPDASDGEREAQSFEERITLTLLPSLRRFPGLRKWIVFLSVLAAIVAGGWLGQFWVGFAVLGCAYFVGLLAFLAIGKAVVRAAHADPAFAGRLDQRRRGSAFDRLALVLRYLMGLVFGTILAALLWSPLGYLRWRLAQWFSGSD
ncbi:MAG: hypothetical protein ACAI43_23030 [Phycisphaerae bacterium]